MSAQSEAVAHIRIALIAEALRSLDELKSHTGSTATDLMNRGIQALAFIENEKRAGSQLLIRRPDGTQYVVESL